MPTNEELVAITYALTRVRIEANKGSELAKRHDETLCKYIQKVLKQKEMSSDRANYWNKKNKEKHNKYNRESYARKKGKK